MLSEEKILNETKNHNPPCKLNGRSLSMHVTRKVILNIHLVFAQVSLKKYTAENKYLFNCEKK